MIQPLHYLKDPKLWEFMVIFLILGNTGFISSAVFGHMDPERMGAWPVIVP